MAKLNASDLAENGDKAEVATVDRKELSGPTVVHPALNLEKAGVEGDVGIEDTRIPRINLMQKSSGLVDDGEFAPGVIILNKEMEIASQDKPCRVTVVHAKQQYQEKLEFGSPETPNVFDTKREVMEAGGSFVWGSDSYYQPIAHLTLLVENPTPNDPDTDILFPFGFGDRSFALAMYTVSSSGYTSAAKEVFSAARFYAQDGIWKLGWELGCKLKKGQRNSWYVPTLDRTGRHSDDFIEFVEQFVPALG